MERPVYHKLALMHQLAYRHTWESAMQFPNLHVPSNRTPQTQPPSFILETLLKSAWET